MKPDKKVLHNYKEIEFEFSYYRFDNKTLDYDHIPKNCYHIIVNTTINERRFVSTSYVSVEFVDNLENHLDIISQMCLEEYEKRKNITL